MIRQSFRLADLPPDVIATMRGDYPADVFARAVADQVARGLRLDNRTGTLYRDGRWISRFSDPDDHVPATDLDQVSHAMRGTVRNSCSRIMRGFEP